MALLEVNVSNLERDLVEERSRVSRMEEKYRLREKELEFVRGKFVRAKI